MAKGGKLMKLMKKLSFGKTTSSSDSLGGLSYLRSDISFSSSVGDQHSAGGGLHEVYVGRSRRRYMVPSDVVDHPLFRQLAGNCAGAGEITVGCEVVLFDHLLWMLENADPETELTSLDELVGYYAY